MPIPHFVAVYGEYCISSFRGGFEGLLEKILSFSCFCAHPSINSGRKGDGPATGKNGATALERNPQWIACCQATKIVIQWQRGEDSAIASRHGKGQLLRQGETV